MMQAKTKKYIRCVLCALTLLGCGATQGVAMHEQVANSHKRQRQYCNCFRNCDKYDDSFPLWLGCVKRCDISYGHE